MSAGSLFHPIRHVARLTLEAVTPLSIGSGESDADLDAPLFRDWNGLPCLSGAGVAGVLRSLYRERLNDEDSVFGHEPATGADGYASRLLVTFGLAQDSKGACRRDLLSRAEIEGDAVLNLLSQPAPILRESVAINERGAGRRNAKFDRALCPVGTRFSLDLAFDGPAEGQDADQTLLKRLVALFNSPEARFGGNTRRGLGRLKIVPENSWIAAIDRRGDAGRQRWVAFRKAAPHEATRAGGFQPLGKLPDCGPSGRHPVSATLNLEARDYWRAGQGKLTWSPTVAGEKDPARMPLSEPVIAWASGVARIENLARPRLAPVVAAGIKGALAHRTEFHLRRIREQFGATNKEMRLVDALFGSTNDTDGGRAGAVLIDDVVIAQEKSTRRTRHSIDRHTGGGRRGKLFTDEVLWKPKMAIPITVLTGGLDPDLLRALDWAIEDLCEGSLALGAGDAIGDGAMDGAKPIWTGGSASLLEAARGVAS